MKNDNEFQEIGKKTHYKAPAGFFDAISEKTLQKAKQKVQYRRKNLVLWRAMAVAASMAAIVLLGYFMMEPDNKPESNVIVKNNQTIEQQTISQKQEITKQPTNSEIKKAVTETVPEKTMVEENETEEIGDVLADLSDDELLQLVAMLKTDPFISESE